MQFEAKSSRRYPGAILALTLVFAFAFTGVAAAQGTQTGTLTGDVKSADGAALPGVTVTLTSPALQGARTAVTDNTGGYIFRGLAPGQYEITFALVGFGTVQRKQEIALGSNNDVSTTMAVANVQESVEVTAEAPSILATTQVGANLRAETVDKLGTARTIQGIATLAPGLSDGNRTPNAGQLSIAGGFAYDNSFLLNGVDIDDNLFGTPHNLFVEDALQEVQVLTNGVSAEYGRFSGGVINAVTKRGGNKFTGSFRTDFTNPKWQDETLFEKNQLAAGVVGAKPHVDKLSKFYQATLGGPIVKDRLWFFAAGRRETSTEARTTSNLGLSYDFGTINNRVEAKLTGAINANHTLQADYIRDPATQNNNPSLNATAQIDLRGLVNRQLPNDLFVANYNGVLSSNLFVEAQFSRKTFGFRNAGGTSTELHDSPFLTLGRAGIPSSRLFNAPYFDANDPEDRNNRQFTGALSYFLTTGSAGRHDLKVGGEYYTSSRTGGNSQSATSFRFNADPVVVGGVPQVDSNGRVIPNFQPGLTSIDNWIAIRGAQINLNTMSIYLNDRWQLNNHWNFNVGGRYERHTADTTQAGIVTPNSSVFVPRLAATFDPKGDGKWVLQGTYGHYAGRAAETQFANNTNVGNPSRVSYVYNGPAGQGVGFAPGFDLNNYTFTTANFPAASVLLDQGLSTPVVKEWTLQAGTRLGRKGDLKVIYAHRNTSNLLEDFITLAQGKTTITQSGKQLVVDNREVTNSDLGHRSYRAVDVVGVYRVTDKWAVFGNYTMQLKNDGNFEGEGANQPGSYSIMGDRPELYNAARHFPDGRLSQYQKHRVRAFTTYDLSLGKAGRATLGMLYRYDSPQTFSLLSNGVSLTSLQRSLGSAYAGLPTTQTLYYAARGTQQFESDSLIDFALSYELPIWKTARPWFKAELRNAFNSQPLISYDTTLSPDPSSPLDSLGLPTGFTKGSNFGKAVRNADTPVPREFRIAVGFRF